MEHYESVPYRLYPTSEGAWVGDVMPMADEDGLQLYYLYDTDHNGMGYHPIHKFSTTNFYEYRDDGLMVPFGASGDEPDLAIGTGCVVKDRDGRYHCFYTGHNILSRFRRTPFMRQRIIPVMTSGIPMYSGMRKSNATGC